MSVCIFPAVHMIQCSKLCFKNSTLFQSIFLSVLILIGSKRIGSPHRWWEKVIRMASKFATTITGCFIEVIRACSRYYRYCPAVMWNNFYLIDSNLLMLLKSPHHTQRLIMEFHNWPLMQGPIVFTFYMLLLGSIIKIKAYYTFSLLCRQ